MKIKDEKLLKESINSILSVKSISIILSTIIGTLIITVTITLYFHPKTVWDILINISLLIFGWILILVMFVYFIYKIKVNEKVKKQESFKKTVELCEELNK